MSTEFIKIPSKEQLGEITLTKIAFELITLHSIEEEKSVVVPQQLLSRPVVVKINNNQLSITCDVQVKHGKNVNKILSSLQERIFNNIVMMTEVKPTSVDIRVTGFVF
ncbi:MAG: Asp23/Gls24 family envelope stress response protein [Erysipelothrix sp.]|jgi:uncharacterized alkaline shock family protein YloU|nr:Asp23/Gls24 family envelope stress response protein [Erysipelothrix sp.]